MKRKETTQKKLSTHPSLPLAAITKKLAKETRKHVTDTKRNEEINKPKNTNTETKIKTKSKQTENNITNA